MYDDDLELVPEASNLWSVSAMLIPTHKGVDVLPAVYNADCITVTVQQASMHNN